MQASPADWRAVSRGFLHHPLLLAALGLFLGWALLPAPAQAQGSKNAKLDPRGWPKEIQQGHRDFEKQCDGCHDLDLALEKQYAPRSWRKYIVRMIKKDDSELDTPTGRSIYRFLTFYSRNRADLPKKAPEVTPAAPETPPAPPEKTPAAADEAPRPANP